MQIDRGLKSIGCEIQIWRFLRITKASNGENASGPALLNNLGVYKKFFIQNGKHTEEYKGFGVIFRLNPK